MGIYTDRFEGKGIIESARGRVSVDYNIKFGPSDVDAVVEFLSMADYGRAAMDGPATLILENGKSVRCQVVGAYTTGINKLVISDGSRALIAAKT